MKLNTSIAGIDFDGFAYNACGVNDEILKQLEKLGDSDSAAILLKSCSIEPRKGNENPKYIVKSNLIPGCTLNSMGLSNRGLEENLSYVDSLKTTNKKPVIASLTCFSKEEHLILFKAFQDQGKADLIELNFSCPNVGAHGLIGYYPELVDEILTQLDTTKGNIKYGIKLPPYFEEWYFDKISDIILKHNVGFISCINTLGNALVIDAEKESTVIKPNFGRGGLGGDWIKPIALSNVNSFYRRLDRKISIVGVGGVRNGKDAFEFLLAGADSVQVGSAFAQESYPIFTKIHNELNQILESKGYNSVQEAKGKLKFL
ncbi:MAG: dihydroorotate oxidase [bacterium]